MSAMNSRRVTILSRRRTGQRSLAHIGALALRRRLPLCNTRRLVHDLGIAMSLSGRFAKTTATQRRQHLFHFRLSEHRADRFPCEPREKVEPSECRDDAGNQK
jgi:hypothetical protein